MLEDRTIARRQRRGEEADHLPQRIVPRHDREHDPDRFISEEGARHAGHRRVSEHRGRSEEHTSELQSLMRISYAVFCLKKKNTRYTKSEHKIRMLKIYTNTDKNKSKPL